MDVEGQDYHEGPVWNQQSWECLAERLHLPPPLTAILDKLVTGSDRFLKWVGFKPIQSKQHLADTWLGVWAGPDHSQSPKGRTQNYADTRVWAYWSPEH